MAIVDDVVALTQRTHRALDRMSDFFEHSKEVWRIFETGVTTEGRVLTHTNSATGTTVNQNDLVLLADLYVNEHLVGFTFQRFVTIFEAFVFDLLRVLLLHNPRRLGRKQVEFATVLAAPDKEAIVLNVIDRELNELKYDKLRGWFDYLEATVHLGHPTSAEIDDLAEIKATRDVLEHNGGVVNATYILKAGAKARYALGERVEISDAYYRLSWGLVKKVVADVSSEAVARLAPP